MKAAIFDMDGTMVDNMMVHHRAWQKELADLGLVLDLDEVRRQVHGINEEILARLFGDRFTEAEREQIAWRKESRYREIFLKELKLIEGCAALLDQLRTLEIPIAIASAAPPENVDFVVDNLDLRSYFKAILHSKSVTKGKPDPEIYLKTAAQLGVDAKSCIVFEDSPTGAKSSANAGCQTVVITTTHTREEFEGITNIKTFIKDFTELNLKTFLL